MMLPNISNHHARAGLTISQGILLVPIQVELYDDVLNTLKTDALDLIEKRQLRGILLDLSQLHVIDHEIALQLEQLINMAQMLGVVGVVTGLQPGVAAALVEWDDLWLNITTAVNLDAGLQILNSTF